MVNRKIVRRLRDSRCRGNWVRASASLILPGASAFPFRILHGRNIDNRLDGFSAATTGSISASRLPRGGFSSFALQDVLVDAGVRRTGTDFRSGGVIMPHMSRAADVVLQKTLSNMVPAGLTCRGSLCGGSVEHFFVVLRTEVVRFVSDQGSGGRLGSIGGCGRS